jgi:acetate kinase
MGRLDAMVFTGGIGEHSGPVRAGVVDSLGFLGLRLDDAANAADGRDNGGRIDGGGTPAVLVVATDEERMIAQDTIRLVGDA